MYKSPLALATTAIMILLLVTACAEDGEQTATVEMAGAPVTKKANTPVTEKTVDQVTQSETPTPSSEDAGQEAPIMNQPVDFSTPENVAKTMQAISDQAGSRVVRKIDSVMGYMMTYDLGVGRDEAKMYKKLNGKTPNQIIAMGSARR